MKKGFTLIELAIALMVIGLIIGMAMEATTLVYSAEVKATLNKITKIETAFASYYSKHGEFPGIVDGSSNKSFIMGDVYDELIDGGYLGASDFKIDTDSKLYFRIVGCGGDVTGSTYTGARNYGSNYSFDNVCVLPSSEEPSTIRTTTLYLAGAAISPRYACYAESLLDDGKLDAGYGRGLISTSVSNNYFNPEDCEDSGPISAYTYVIY